LIERVHPIQVPLTISFADLRAAPNSWRSCIVWSIAEGHGSDDGHLLQGQQGRMAKSRKTPAPYAAHTPQSGHLSGDLVSPLWPTAPISMVLARAGGGSRRYRYSCIRAAVISSARASSDGLNLVPAPRHSGPVRSRTGQNPGSCCHSSGHKPLLWAASVQARPLLMHAHASHQYEGS
jgi:hypothetical protein